MKDNILIICFILILFTSCKHDNQKFENKYFSIIFPETYLTDSIELGNFDKLLQANIHLKKIDERDKIYKSYSIYKNAEIPFEKRIGVTLYNYYIPKDSAKSTNELLKNHLASILRSNENFTLSFNIISDINDTILNNNEFSYLVFEENNKIGAISYLKQNNNYYSISIKFKNNETLIDSSDKKEVFEIIKSVKY